jgi:hypothetical protein
LCLRKSDVGTAMVFYDVTKAEEEGYLGTNPKIWGEDEYATLIEMLTVGLGADKEEWERFRWHPTAWSLSGEEEGKGPEPAQRWALGIPANIAANPSPLAISAMSQPAFVACNILGGQGNAGSRGSSTTASSKDDAHVKTAKKLLVQIVKEQAAGALADVPPPPPPKIVKMESGIAIAKIAGKKTERSRSTKARSPGKKLGADTAFEDECVKIRVKGSS